MLFINQLYGFAKSLSAAKFASGVAQVFSFREFFSLSLLAAISALQN